MKMIKMIMRSMMMNMTMMMICRSVKDIDLYTGGLAETPVSGAVIGPTFLVSSRFFWFKKPWLDLFCCDCWFMGNAHNFVIV